MTQRFFLQLNLVSLLALTLSSVLGCQRNDSAKGDDRAVAASVGNNAAYSLILRGQVDVEGGLVRVSINRDGRVARVLHSEGDDVSAGTVLAELDASLSVLALKVAQAELQQARAQVGVASAKAMALRLSADRLKRGAQDGVATAAAAEDAAQASAIARAETAAANSAVTLAQTRLDSAQFGASNDQISAPIAGKIARRSVQVGANVALGNELFVIVPAGPRIVRAEVEDSSLMLVHPGMRALIVAESDERDVQHATVLRLAELFGRHTPTDAPNEKQDTRVIECILQLDEARLRVGQRVLVKLERDPG